MPDFAFAGGPPASDAGAIFCKTALVSRACAAAAMGSPAFMMATGEMHMAEPELGMFPSAAFARSHLRAASQRVLYSRYMRISADRT